MRPASKEEGRERGLEDVVDVVGEPPHLKATTSEKNKFDSQKN
jgi:hypothetical protein